MYLQSWKGSHHQGREYKHEEGSVPSSEELQQRLTRAERPVRKQGNPDGRVTETKRGECYKKEGADNWKEGEKKIEKFSPPLPLVITDFDKQFQQNSHGDIDIQSDWNKKGKEKGAISCTLLFQEL